MCFICNTWWKIKFHSSLLVLYIIGNSLKKWTYPWLKWENYKGLKNLLINTLLVMYTKSCINWKYWNSIIRNKNYGTITIKKRRYHIFYKAVKVCSLYSKKYQKLSAVSLKLPESFVYVSICCGNAYSCRFFFRNLIKLYTSQRKALC